MSRHFRNDEELVQAIHKLPKTMQAPEGSWPEITAGMAAAGKDGTSGRRIGWGHQALAASVAIAFVAGLMFGRQIGVDETPSAASAPMDFAMLAVLEASEREYQAAFREFIPLGSSRTMLEAQTVENIENSWAEMQEAESALLAALGDYPENHYLNQKLLDLRAHQLGFMKQLAMLDQFSRRKT